MALSLLHIIKKMLVSIFQRVVAKLKCQLFPSKFQEYQRTFKYYEHIRNSQSLQLLIWIIHMSIFRKKCLFALSGGCLASPTARLMLLGDAGAGKTSTCCHLLDKPHPEHHHPTEFVDSKMAEWTEVDAEWNEIIQDENGKNNDGEDGEANESSVLDQALATFCLYRETKVYPNPRQWIWRIINMAEKWSPLIFLLGVWIYLDISLDERIKQKLSFEKFEQNVSLICMLACSLLFCITFGVFFNLNLVQTPYFGEFYSLMILIFLILVKNEYSIFDFSLFIDDLAENFHFLWHLIVIGLLVGVVCNFLLLLKPRSWSFLFFTGCVLCLAQHVPVRGFNNAFVFIYISSVIFFISCFEHKRNILSKTSFLLREVTMLTVIFFGFLLFFKSHIDRFFFRYIHFVFGTIAGFGICRLVLTKVHRSQTHKQQDGWEVVINVLVSYEMAAFSILNLELTQFQQFLFINPFFPLIFSLVEFFHWRLNRIKNLPANKVWRMISKANDCWPVKLSILDCGGQKIYHAVHHIYMTAHSTYIVVFRLPDLCEDFEASVRRIRFWLASVTAHAQHPDARVIIVGTHAAFVPSEEKEEVLEQLEKTVIRRYYRRLACNIIAIDNAQRNESEEEMKQLRRLIWETATRAEFVQQPNRISWFYLVDYVHNVRRVDSLRKSLIVSRDELWEKLREPCHLSGRAEFCRMLRFFHDRGDIFIDARSFDTGDSVLLDPELLELAARRIIPLTDEHKPIFFSREELESVFASLTAAPGRLLVMLEDLGIVLPWRERGQFLVPHNLTERCEDSRLLHCPAFIFRFSFKDFNPQPVFLRLLSKLTIISSDDALFKNAIRARTDKGVEFSLEIYAGFKLWVYTTEQNESRVLEVVYFLQGLLQRVCKRHFPFVVFHLQAPCECSRTALLNNRIAPASADFVTIQEYRQWPLSHLIASFPSRRLSFVCSNEPWRLSAVDTKLTATNRRQLDEEVRSCLSLETLSAPTRDVFVSCARGDRSFLFNEILPKLEAPWSMIGMINNDNAETVDILRHGLSVSADFCDDASPGQVLWSSGQRRSVNLANSHAVLAVISSASVADPETRHERCLALMMNKPVVPVLRSCLRSIPQELLHLQSLQYPAQVQGSELVRTFYVPLLCALRSAVTEQATEGGVATKKESGH